MIVITLDDILSIGAIIAGIIMTLIIYWPKGSDGNRNE